MANCQNILYSNRYGSLGGYLLPPIWILGFSKASLLPVPNLPSPSPDPNLFFVLCKYLAFNQSANDGPLYSKSISRQTPGSVAGLSGLALRIPSPEYKHLSYTRQS